MIIWTSFESSYWSSYYSWEFCILLLLALSLPFPSLLLSLLFSFTFLVRALWKIGGGADLPLKWLDIVLLFDASLRILLQDYLPIPIPLAHPPRTRRGKKADFVDSIICFLVRYSQSRHDDWLDFCVQIDRVVEVDSVEGTSRAYRESCYWRDKECDWRDREKVHESGGRSKPWWQLFWGILE